jgi:ribosomal protein S27AE
MKSEWRKEGLSLPDYDGNARVEVATYILDGKRYHLREATGDLVMEYYRKAQMADVLVKALAERCPRCRDGVPFGTNKTIIRMVSAASGKPIAYHQTDTSPRLPCLLTEQERIALAQFHAATEEATRP